jgi:hypothetical protein
MQLIKDMKNNIFMFFIIFYETIWQKYQLKRKEEQN